MMKRLLLIAGLFFALPLSAQTCAEQIAESLASSDTLGTLAKSIEITPAQLKYFLENEKLADRVQALLIARFLINERSEDLIAELYWRAQGTTKYSQTASTWNRISDWIYNRRFWSPFYRDRQQLFADSLRAIDETLPDSLLKSFNAACSRVEEPGFLKGMRAVSRDLKPTIGSYAISEFRNLRDEIPRYLSEKQSLIARFAFSKPSNPLPPKPETLAKILTRESFYFLESIDNLPSDTEALQRELKRYTDKHLKNFPKIAGTVTGLIINLHFDISPASYDEFSEWMAVRFEKLLRLEREKLLKDWRNRPGQRPPVAKEQPTAEPESTVAVVEEKNISDSDEFLLAELELFADTAPVEPSKTPRVDAGPKSKRPYQRFRQRKQESASGESDTPAPPPTGFLVVLTEKARADLVVLSRSPRLDGQIRKCLNLLSQNPNYPSLRTHVGTGATQEWSGKKKVFRSSVNMMKGGYRIHWIYGDEEKTIEVLEIVHHDEM